MAQLRNLYTAPQIREIEQRQINERGTPGYTLMLRAGQALFDVCTRHLKVGDQVLVVTGPGNNGGDGYVGARLLREADFGVKVVSLSDPAKLQGDAKTAKDDWLPWGEIEPFEGTLMEPADLIVDAILGTGLERNLEGQFLVVVQLINEHPAPVIAVDIPSGLSSETGQSLGSAIVADKTVTFIGLKQGLFTGKGPHYCGSISLDTLETDEDLLAAKPSARLVDKTLLAPLLPPRAFDTHKGQCGHTLLIGGNKGMPGAISMAGEAAARSGSGLVSIATHAEHASLIPMTHPELMSHGIETISQLTRLMENANVIAIGPGLGSSGWARELFEQALSSNKPLVIDADGLNLLAESFKDSPTKNAHWILTPHPGEAARLLNITTADVESDRPGAVREIQKKYGGIAVLKGAGTLIHDGGDTYLCTAGNPGMASGGMGDVLTGTIAGLWAQLKNPVDAAVTGVIAHSHAADLAAGEQHRGMLARDVLEKLREAVNPK